MKIKKYEVTDMKEALRQIKEELGPDAVILTTKKVMKPSGLGLFPKAVLEVIAAVDYDGKGSSPAKQSGNKKIPSRTKRKPETPPAVEEEFPPYQSPAAPGHNLAEELLPSQGGSPDDDAYLNSLLKELTISVAPPRDGSGLLPEEDEEPYIPPIKASPPPVSDKSAEKIEELLKSSGLDRLPELFDEIREMRREITEMKKALDEPIHINVDLPQNLKEYYNILTRNGLDDLVAYRFLKNAEKNMPELMGKAQLKNVLLEKLAEQLPVEADFLTALNNKITAFVGPTGVGKTTTIAKIAANLALRYTQKVCLITVDNFRIGAVNQLKTYADIVRLPLYVATSRQELSTLLPELQKEYDYILLDSTGRSPYDATGVSDAIDMLSAVPELLAVLVLSIAANHAELGDMYERYAGFSPRYIIFTKLDETRYFGSMGSLSIKKKTPLLFFSTGQGVPEDMEIPDGKKIAKKLLQDIPCLWKDK